MLSITACKPCVLWYMTMGQLQQEPHARATARRLVSCQHTLVSTCSSASSPGLRLAGSTCSSLPWKGVMSSALHSTHSTHPQYNPHQVCLIPIRVHIGEQLLISLQIKPVGPAVPCLVPP